MRQSHFIASASVLRETYPRKPADKAYLKRSQAALDIA